MWLQEFDVEALRAAWAHIVEQGRVQGLGYDVRLICMHCCCWWEWHGRNLRGALTVCVLDMWLTWCWCCHAQHIPCQEARVEDRDTPGV